MYPKKGLCDLADKGSIFFDEIGNIPLETQAKLLRVMQEREFMRLGGMETIKVDVRIIAATNCDLKQMMEAGRFREDLYYRLHVINIYLPPLRQRKDDIPVLAQHFLEKYGEENNKKTLELAPEALDLLMDTTGRATCANSKMSWSAPSCSPPGRASVRTSFPITCEQRPRFRFRSSSFPRKASRSRTSLPTSRSV